MKRALVLLTGPGFAAMLVALASSAPSLAASGDLMSCKGTRGQIVQCCERVQQKPLWFRSSDLSCRDVVACSPKKGKLWCYIKIVKEDRPNEPNDPPASNDGGGTPGTSSLN